MYERDPHTKYMREIPIQNIWEIRGPCISYGSPQTSPSTHTKCMWDLRPICFVRAAGRPSRHVFCMEAHVFCMESWSKSWKLWLAQLIGPSPKCYPGTVNLMMWWLIWYWWYKLKLRKSSAEGPARSVRPLLCCVVLSHPPWCLNSYVELELVSNSRLKTMLSYHHTGIRISLWYSTVFVFGIIQLLPYATRILEKPKEKRKKKL